MSDACSASAVGNRLHWMNEVRGRVLWQLNVAVFGIVTLWMLVDGRFPATVAALWSLATKLVGSTDLPGSYGPLLSWRVTALAVLAMLAAASVVGALAALFVGADRHRRLRTWLAFTAVVAGWFALATSWREVAWQGQQWRVRAHLSGFSALAETLRSEWPFEDGQRAELGAYMAYPRVEPRMLLILTRPRVPVVELPFSAVERSDDGAIRFALAGGESGAWLEWHAPGDVPSSFVGGLHGDYRLDRSANLGDGWHLVRYWW